MALTINAQAVNAAGTKVLLTLGVGNPPIDPVNLASGPTVPKSLTILADGRSVDYSAYTLESGGGLLDATAVIGITLAATIYRGESVTIANSATEGNITDSDEAGLPSFATSVVTNNSTTKRDTILNLIRLNLIATIEAIADSGTYHQALSAEGRKLDQSNAREQLKAVVTMASDERVNDTASDSDPQGQIVRRAEFRCQITRQQPESADSSTDIDQLHLWIASDVQKALRVDKGRGTHPDTGEALAYDTDDVEIEELTEAGPTLLVGVRYSVNVDDWTKTG